MDQSPFKKGFPWLSAGVLLFLVSIVLYLYDSSRSDNDILQEVKSGLQADFDACLRYYQLDSIARIQVPKPVCVACELTYDELGRLIQWSNNEYLPVQKQINTLKVLNQASLLTYDDRAYYQLRRRKGPQTHVTLIPISIKDKINNEFLLPFVFFGRWQQHLSKEIKWPISSLFSIDEIRALKVSLNSPSTDGISIADPSKKHVFTIQNIPVDAFRFQTRAAVTIFFILGLIIFCIYLRIYALYHWDYRYYINLALLFGVLFFRYALWVTDLPATFIDVDLFSPNVLAFDEYIAPSLGDLTINIFTLAIVVWVLYVHFFRLVNIGYRNIFNYRIIPWIVAGSTIIISSILFKVYLNFFESIITNSQVDIAFTNIFKASTYSFIILLDIGILLLSFGLIIITLFRFNILFGQREGYNSFFIGLHIIVLLGINTLIYLNWSDFGLQDAYVASFQSVFEEFSTSMSLVLLVSTCLSLLFIIVYRQPFRQILRYDLVNYVLLILAFSTLVTYSVIGGIEIKNQVKVNRIANRVLGGQLGSTVYTYETAMSNIESDQESIANKYQELKNSSAYSQFADWIKERYFSSNFTQFDVSLFLFDAKGRRLDRTLDDIWFGPGAELSLQDRGEPVNQQKTLYKLPNFKHVYLDLFVGTFSKILANDSLSFYIKLSPARLETEGLYPSLSMEKELYEDTKLINSFDHAVYQDGILYSTGGRNPFPIYLEEDKKLKTEFKHEIRDDAGNRFTEYIESIEENRVVLIRHASQDFFQIITTFSFIFYFFSLASLLLVVIPVIVLRNLRTRANSQNLPLRTKIRLGLLAMSILPMFVIIVFLTPFISERYEEEARIELSSETERISKALGQEYILMRKDALSRMSLTKAFEKKVKNLSKVVRNDINVYNEFGMRIASTQPVIYKSGFTTDLMNAEAFDALKTGRISELVIDEKVGRLSYFSGYRPIIGNYRRPIGYVNVPYIARQDQLDERVLNFLAYLANIYLLVFLLLNFVAVLVSNTITQPLSLIQQRLSATGLGNANKPIKYESKDEIGAIVTAYNQMVQKLSDSERKLSQTNRELAWRQMARQVAHEIKNPLTPMRLSIQHLERAWKVKSNSLDKMFPRVMKTLMVQIDSLVRIANSFHEFAKMPDPVKDKIMVNEVLLEVVDLYAQSEEATWLIDIPQEKFYAFSDRDQLSRCFNNIIKNALQAIDENGTIHISMAIENQHALIHIKDNGKGMTEEVQKKVFEPNFSTKNSGMGLGLAIVRRIIESSGGSINFESKLNKGTTFIINLPSVEIA